MGNAEKIVIVSAVILLLMGCTQGENQAETQATSLSSNTASKKMPTESNGIVVPSVTQEDRESKVIPIDQQVDTTEAEQSPASLPSGASRDAINKAMSEKIKASEEAARKGLLQAGEKSADIGGKEAAAAIDASMIAAEKAVKSADDVQRKLQKMASEANN